MALIPQEQIPTDFDDEEQERDDLFIEKMVHDFRDEPLVEHDVYPESDDERNEDVPEREHIHIRRGDGILYKKQTFFNGVAFKECVLDFALRTGRNLTQYRYDKDKIGFKCLGGADKGSRCPWQVYAMILPNDAMWRTTVFVDKHTCIPSGDVYMFKVPVIARMFLDRIRDEPEYFMPLKIKETIKERFGINVSRPQCQAGRLKALKWIETEYDHQFSRLRDYAVEIVANNKGSTVVIDTVKNADGQDVFSRFYVCFDVLRRTWKETCKPLLGVDGCFLKDKMKGQFLVAVDRDADIGIYPVAWGVVEVENIENWTCL